MRTARTVMLEFYEYADRDVPEWFPRRPAEREHNAGRDRWFDLLKREDISHRTVNYPRTVKDGVINTEGIVSTCPLTDAESDFHG